MYSNFELLNLTLIIYISVCKDEISKFLKKLKFSSLNDIFNMKNCSFSILRRKNSENKIIRIGV